MLQHVCGVAQQCLQFWEVVFLETPGILIRSILGPVGAQHEPPFVITKNYHDGTKQSARSQFPEPCIELGKLVAAPAIRKVSSMNQDVCLGNVFELAMQSMRIAQMTNRHHRRMLMV